jgi:hypothetical protein
MADEKTLVVIEIAQLRIILKEEFKNLLIENDLLKINKSVNYSDGEQLSIVQVAEYLGVSTKTINNYRKSRKIPEPTYNLSGKPRWTVLQLREIENTLRAKQKFPI